MRPSDVRRRRKGRSTQQHAKLINQFVLETHRVRVYNIIEEPDQVGPEY